MITERQSHLPHVCGVVGFGDTVLFRIGVAAATVNGVVVEIPFADSIHLILFVSFYYFLPAVNLHVTPLDAVSLAFRHFLWQHAAVGAVMTVVRVALLEPGQIHGFAAGVLEGIGRGLIRHLREEARALVFPLRYHHGLNLILRVLEGSGDLLIQRHGLVQSKHIFLSLRVALDQELSAGPDEEVGRVAHIDISFGSHVGIGSSGGNRLYFCGNEGGVVGPRLVKRGVWSPIELVLYLVARYGYQTQSGTELQIGARNDVVHNLVVAVGQI